MTEQQTGKPKGKRGGARAGAGRKAGKRRVVMSFRERYPVWPLEYLMGLVNDTTVSGELRFEAAKRAAPYVHPRLAPVALQPAEPQYSLDLTKLTDEELAFFERIVAKAQIVHPESETDQLPKLIDDNTAEE